MKTMQIHFFKAKFAQAEAKANVNSQASTM